MTAELEVITKAETLTDRIEAAIAAQAWPRPSSARRGRNPQTPYVPTLVYAHGSYNTLKHYAFATRDEAVAAAERHVERLKHSLRIQLADQRCRDLRRSYGLPEEIAPEGTRTPSWKAEWINGDDGKWRSSAMRFATPEEAQANCFKTHVRHDAFWAQGYAKVTKMRTVECDDPVNHYWEAGSSWRAHPDVAWGPWKR